LLVVALFLAGWLASLLARDLALWVLGREVQAEVVDLWVEQLGDQKEGELAFQPYLQYRFTTRSGETITTTMSVSMNEWASGSEEGGQIDVVYFPPYPQHNRIDDTRFVPLMVCGYMPAVLIAVALLVAGWQLFSPAIRRGAGEWEAEAEKRRDREREE